MWNWQHWKLATLATFSAFHRLDADEAGAVPAELHKLGRFLVADGGFFRGGTEVLHRLAPFLGLADELVQALAEFLYLQSGDFPKAMPFVPYNCVFASRSIS